MGRIRDRIRARRNAKKPQKQHYGGSESAGDLLRQRNKQEIADAGNRETEGIAALDAERAAARAKSGELDSRAAIERYEGGQRYDVLAQDVQRAQQQSSRQAGNYGRGADRSVRDFGAGRSAILGGASDLEALGRGAAGRYTSAADAAFKASTERTQRNALSLAAGRGNDSIRTALATAEASNRQAMLEQQAVRANEMNALLDLEKGAITGAADIRGGLSAQDLQAAQAQAARQEAARIAANQALGLRGDVATANAQLGLQTNEQRAALAATDASLGMGAAGARAEAGAAARNAFLGAEGMQEGAQLGSNMQSEAARLANAQTKGFTGFLGRVAGGLGNVKAVADSSSMGPGTKLLGKQQAVPG